MKKNNFRKIHYGIINCDGNAMIFIPKSNSDYQIAKKRYKMKDDSVNITFKNNTAIVEFLDKNNIRMSERIIKLNDEYINNNDEMSDNAKAAIVFLIFVVAGVCAYFYLPNH